MKFLQKPLSPLLQREKYVGLAYLVFQLFLLPTLLRLMAMAFSMETDSTLVNTLYFSLNFICCIAIFGHLLKNSLKKAIAEPDRLLIATAIGFGIYRVSTIALSIVVILLFPGFSNLNDTAVMDVFGDSPLLMILCTVVLAPVTEELLYRGLVFGWLREKNARMAFFLSALIFAAIHVVQYIGSYSVAHVFVALVLYLPAGLTFVWAYQHSGTILAPIIIHAINNFLAVLVLR